MSFSTNHFGVFDYIAVVLTLLLSLCIGLYFALTGSQSKEELLVGGRKMGIFPVAASMMVTYFSAISVIGIPSEVYTQGTQIFFMQIVGTVAIPISAWIYVRVFHEMKLTSVYEYLEHRFDSLLVRRLAAFTFVIQICLLNGVLLYAPSIALETIMGVPAWISITVIGLIGAGYTSVGGLKAVIWTDVFQWCIVMLGLFAILAKGFYKAGGVSESFEAAYNKGRLSLLDFTVDPFMRHNSLNILLGYGCSTIISYGASQPLAQRYCSVPTVSGAYKSILVVLPLKLFAFAVVTLTGITLVSTYAGCDPLLRGEIRKPDALIPYFVVEELSFIPGMMGLFTSCIFSAVLSSVSSMLNSLAAVTWEDILSRISYFEKFSCHNQAKATKYLVCFYGVLSIVIAFLAQNAGQIFEVTRTAVGATAGPLGAMFLCGLFIPFMNKFGAISGLLTGLVSAMTIAINSLLLGKKYIMNPTLPTDLNSCTDMDFIVNITATSRLPRPQDFEYPDKLYTLSYVLIPLVGALVTIFVGSIVSIVSGQWYRQRVNEKYLHPWIRSVWYVKKSAGKTEMQPNSLKEI